MYTLSPPERTVLRAVLLDQPVADVPEEVRLADRVVDLAATEDELRRNAFGRAAA